MFQCFNSKEVRVNLSQSIRHEKHSLLLQFDHFVYSSESN